MVFILSNWQRSGIIVKKLLALLILIVILSEVFITVSANNSGDLWHLEMFNIDGVVASCELIKNEKGELLFPVRVIMEALGAEVTWCEGTGDILLDFSDEEWMLKNNGDSFAELYNFLAPELSWHEASPDGYSDVSGRYIEIRNENLGSKLYLIDGVNYIDKSGLSTISKVFRSNTTTNNNTRTVKIFILPKPFYAGEHYTESYVKLGDKEIGVLKANTKITAISFEDFMMAIGGKSRESYFDKYIEGHPWMDGYKAEFYKAFQYKRNLFLYVYSKYSYHVNVSDDGEVNGYFLYQIRNVTKENEQKLCFIRQGQQDESEPDVRGNWKIDGIGYMVNNKVYMDISNAEFLVKFFGYEIKETDGDLYIEKVSDNWDTSLYKILYK